MYEKAYEVNAIPETYLKYAKVLIKEKQYEKAEKAVKKIVQAEPMHLVGLKLLGTILRKQKKYEEALKYLSKVI